MSNNIGFAAGAFMLAGLVGVSATYNYGTSDNVNITVKDKERVVTGSGENVSSKYLIFTHGKDGEKGEVFENTDSYLRLKFSSSTLYGDLDKGKSYNCDVYGWRVPFFSMYRNLVDCTPAAAPQLSQ